MWQKLSCEQICLCPQYSKSPKTGSEHAADSKLRYTIQFSILMLCAKYQEAGLCGSQEKCDRNYLLSNFASVPNIHSRVKQEGDRPLIQNCVTRYSSPYWCSVPNIRKLACVVLEKNVTEIILWICLCPQYSKSCQTGSGHAADSKMRYTIQFSILMLCAKYQEASLCGSREKCDRNFLWRRRRRRRRRKTTQDDRSDPYMSPTLKRAGDTIKHDCKSYQI